MTTKTKAKPKTQEQLDRATDLRLRKTYNIGLKDYEYLFEKGRGGCWICRRPPSGNRLHVDHDHAWKKVSLLFQCPKESRDGLWHAQGFYRGSIYEGFGLKKSLASLMCKKKLLRASVRGLLCYPCNSGLQKFSDNMIRLQSSADYLARFYQQNPLNGREGQNDAQTQS